MNMWSITYFSTFLKLEGIHQNADYIINYNGFIIRNPMAEGGSCVHFQVP